MLNRTLKISLLFFLFSFSFSQVIILNEFHAKPVSGQIEFVELLHRGNSPIDVENWLIADNGPGKMLPSAIVQPGEFIILADDSTMYPSIPTSAHYLIPSGGLPSLNNSGDKIKLTDTFGVVIDSLVYDSSWDVDYAFSTEKIRPELTSDLSGNWKASKDSLGTPGAPNSVLPLAIDGEIITTNTAINPSIIVISETTTVSVDVKNIGLNPFSGSVTIKQNGTVVGTESFTSLAALATTNVQVVASVLSSGEVTLDILLEISGDLDLANNYDSVNIGVKYEPHVFYINEFHSQPVDDQIEFVEILHRGNDPIEMEDWRITDSRDGTTYRLPNSTVLPGEFVIIASDSSMYPSVPIGTHYLTPTGGLPALNNSGDGIRIFDPYNTLIDSLTYDSTWDVVSGISTEKILPELPSELSANWRSSISLNNMTPGLPNSVIPYNIDGAINEGISFTPSYPKPGESVIAKVSVQNVGIQSISGTVSAKLNDITIGSTNTTILNMGETTVISIPLSSLPSGRHKIVFEFNVTSDENITNNSTSKKLGISFEPGVVQFNEFHAEPGDNEIEFVELVSNISLVMDGWRIADKSSRNLLHMQYVKPGDFIVIASDTSLKPITNPDAHYLLAYDGLPTLNNSSDAIYLLDMNNTIIDSLIYDSSWPMVADTSTEKLRPDFVSNDPANWRTSTANARMTPGYINSIYLIDHDGELIADSIYHSPEFPQTNESVELFIPVTNHGAQAISGDMIVIENGIKLGSINFANLARRDTLILQFTIPDMNSGIHPIQIELNVAYDQNLNNNSTIDTIYVSYEFGTVLINEFLARPTSTQAEFVELVTFDEVALANWSIADKTNTLHNFTGGIVEADKYILLSEDPAFAAIIPPEAGFVDVTNFPSLNNYGDAIYLRDFTGTLIDSLVYTTWWASETGKSTEKIFPQLVSNDSTGWKISTDPTGMTPGRPNSVTAKSIDGAILHDEIFFTPEFPKSTDNIILTIPILNIGLQTISGEIFVKIENQNLYSSTFSEIGIGDTLFYDILLQPLPSGIHALSLNIDIDADENLGNNSVVFPLGVSYNFGAVTLNEFLADPEDPLSEFVEIVAQEDVNLSNWEISDNRKELVTFSGSNAKAGDYIVLSEDTSLAALLPSNTVFIYFNNFPSLNNSGDGIFIYDFTGNVIDSLHYSNTDWPLKGGKSTEKLHPNFVSNDATNWQVSTDTSNSTVGRVNSVILQNINGAILPELSTHYPEFPHPSESIAFDIAVVNNGISDISGNVSINHFDNELGIKSFNSLKSEDTTYVSFNIEPLESGHNLLDVKLTVPGDMNSADNLSEHSVYVSYPFGAVTINEFLARPDTTQAEFMEIFSFNDVNLGGWSISDNTLKKYYFDELFSSADQPLVITADSTFIDYFSSGIPYAIPIGGWPTLNNTSDGIFLYDATGAIIDSLHYDEDWPIADGRSTEKFRPEFESDNPKRWGVAVNTEAMTPGLKNSLHFDEISQKGALEFEANPFSPNGDGIDDDLLIKYKLPFEQGIIKLQIYDITGRNIATPYWNVYFPQEGLLKWNGKRDDSSNARIGIYIVKLSAKDPASNKTWEKVKTVVLAKQL